MGFTLTFSIDDIVPEDKSDAVRTPYEDTLHAWERRGNAIYTQGKYNQDGYMKGSAVLVFDFGRNFHVDDIDRLVMSHNDALDAFAAEMEQSF